MVKKAVVFVVGLMNVAWGELMPAPEGAVAARSRQAAVMSIPSGADMLAVVPADVLGEIFQYLGSEDVGRLRQVSKGCWQRIAVMQAEPVYLYRLMMQSADPRFFKEYMRPPMPILGYSVLEDLRHKFGSYKRLYEIKFMDGVFAKEHVAQYREMIKKLDAKAEELKGQGAKANWRDIEGDDMVRDGNGPCGFEQLRIPPVHYRWAIPDIVVQAAHPLSRPYILKQPQSVIEVLMEKGAVPYAEGFYFPLGALPVLEDVWQKSKLEICGNRNLLLLLEFGLLPRWTRESLVIKDVALTVLPPWVPQVQGLQELVLENTGMTGLYPNLGALTSVTRLVIRNQPLQNLDFAILAELTKKVPVVVIDKGDAVPWTNIPPALFINSQPLRVFNLQHLLNFDTLQHLELENCSLTDASFAVSENFDLSSLNRLNCLVYLSLNYNSLTKVPGFVGYLPNLQFLCLYGNRLQSLKESIGVLTQLQKLKGINLSKNQLQNMSFLRALTTLPNLCGVRLCENQIPIATEREHWEIQGRTILIKLDGNPKLLRPLPNPMPQILMRPIQPVITSAGMFDVIEQYLSRWWE